MSRFRGFRPWCALGAFFLLATTPAYAGNYLLGGGLFGCGTCKCPPPMKWYSEGPPSLCFKCACPRPVCDPCSLEHYGYYQTCWTPWAFPPDWSHCKCPPPGAVLPPPAYPPYTPRTPVEPRQPDTQQLPAPKVKRTVGQYNYTQEQPAPIAPVYQGAQLPALQGR